MSQMTFNGHWIPDAGLSIALDDGVADDDPARQSARVVPERHSFWGQPPAALADSFSADSGGVDVSAAAGSPTPASLRYWKIWTR